MVAPKVSQWCTADTPVRDIIVAEDGSERERERERESNKAKEAEVTTPIRGRARSPYCEPATKEENMQSVAKEYTDT